MHDETPGGIRDGQPLIDEGETTSAVPEVAALPAETLEAAVQTTEAGVPPTAATEDQAAAVEGTSPAPPEETPISGEGAAEPRTRAAAAPARPNGSELGAEALAATCEAILAAAGEVVTLDALASAAGEGVGMAEVEAALEVIRSRHEQPGSGMFLERVAGGARLATRPEHEGALRTFLGIRSRARLSQAALETLAIVAYRQPITLPEVNFLRGVNSAGVIRTLVERKLVKVAGRKQVVGTPLLYRTTKEFLVHFGLDDLAALPAIEEVEEGAAERGSSGP